jgi:competence protein ComEC
MISKLYISLIGVMLVAILMCGGWYVWWPDGYLHLIFCDVGQGDATLIYWGWRQVLVDAGPDEQALKCLSEHLPPWDKTLDLVVLTHLDADHVGGIPAVFEQYQIGHFLWYPATKDTQLSKTVLEVLLREEEQVALWSEPELGQRWAWRENEKKLFFEVIHPNLPLTDKGGTETTLSAYLEENTLEDIEDNDESIALNVSFMNFSAALLADLEKKGELAVLNHKMIRDIDVIKAGHHGSKTSTTAELLTTSQPEQAVISAGKNNKYGHPDQSVITRLKQAGINIWRTDEQGTLELITDGESYWWR